ncbi:MAG: cytochrome c biogenesis protein CcsA [Chitinophagaceae bacterium]|nr:cytochrome c biogenesis protein CcsA [Chitinophagaceae bacterium]MCA6452734.1 cytochrome c biogenesis protein CcsA [Chitinophagaceae bacterium]MCA6457307.1 cytochrome c biogenesis protein CcsA [Chitinophagaceae bacterium]MCA6457538.1 cytochrome c biogenesis protein CcsA [Chitinophagaceae bacterium]MCA6463252.1 cytochrome c biogenesis protein CcsA [Chitinophagaceae bacterium]
MNYIGEHLLPGQIGHFFAVLSLVASLLATIAYALAFRTRELTDKQSWIRLARGLFLAESISVLAMFITLYYIISHHLFEYKYAFTHSDRSLQVEYLLACFWEGQEGSFMLWSFWHCVLGWILIWKSKEWESGVMMVISFAQFCLASMIIGIYFFGNKVGSSPFVLSRNEGFFDQAPIFKDMMTGALRADYLTLIKDGSGLNTLLQNYWMVIHPPVLFLGFASTIVPFAYAIAGLLSRKHEWIKPTLPWASFSAAMLGTGVMMGAAWAYESLSFGGYWAWDPVENASLVPWLTLVAGLHTNLIYRNSGYSLRPTYFFYIISFILVLYSTFLTRSGILGDTSVHAFTDLGMNVQLLLFVLVFLLPALFLYFREYKTIPAIAKEENTYSREFWIFIGSLVLFLSGIIIISKTSVPVVNKVLGTNIAPPEDVEFAYNQIQIFVAIVVGILTAITQYLKYKDTSKAFFGKKIWVPTLISVLISLSISLFADVNYDKKGPGFLFAIHMAIFASVYAVVANALYIWKGLNGKIKAAGASVAHVGFGLVLVGILISSSKKTVLSWNTTGITPLQGDPKAKGNPAGDPAENITLFKTVATDMGKFMVTYTKDTLNPLDRKRYFEIDFVAKKGGEHFKLYPDVIKQNKGGEGFSANPAAKHYWHKDIFVYITSFQENNREDTTTFRNREAKVGDTLFYGNGFMILNKVEINPAELQRKVLPGETSLFLDMTVISKDGRRYPVKPGIALKGMELRSLPDSVLSQSLVLKFNRVLDQNTGKLEIGVKESGAITDLITLKVYEFPMINVLWLGVVVMVLGFVMSIRQRLRESGRGALRVS